MSPFTRSQKLAAIISKFEHKIQWPSTEALPSWPNSQDILLKADTDRLLNQGKALLLNAL